MKHLRDLNALPSINVKTETFNMNWDLKVDYDYRDLSKRLSSALSKTTNKKDNSLYFATIRLAIIIITTITIIIIIIIIINSQMRAEKSQNSISRFVQTSSYEDMAKVIKKYDEDLQLLNSKAKSIIIDRKRCSMIIYRARLLGAMGKIKVSLFSISSLRSL